MELTLPKKRLFSNKSRSIFATSIEVAFDKKSRPFGRRVLKYFFMAGLADFAARSFNFFGFVFFNFPLHFFGNLNHCFH